MGFVESSDAVYIATQNGRYTIDGERMYASGYPDPIVATDANLGLVSSTDQGKSWSAVSLNGTADFHDLEISHSSRGPTTIYGLDGANAVIRVGRDGGSTWTSGAALAMRDVAACPALPGTIYGTTSDGVKVSHEHAASFEFSPDALTLSVVATSTRVAADQRGIVASSDLGATSRILVTH